MDLTQAVAKHADWKFKLRSAITNKETMDVATVSADNCCELGKWLHGEAKAAHGTLKAYSECVKVHAQFHKEAGKVAEAINAKKFTEAEAMLGEGTPYTAASMNARVAILAMKKEAGL